MVSRFRKGTKHLITKVLGRYFWIFVENQLCADIANFIVFNQIEGDYLEFGVWRGDWFADFYAKISREWKNFHNHARLYCHEIDELWFQRKQFVAFDSFKGLPSVTTTDTPIHSAKEGIYSQPKRSFIKNIRRRGVDLDRVRILEGWFSETLNNESKQRLGLEKAAAIFVDCDLYESAVPVFKFISDFVHTGTVIIIDDWFRYEGDPRKGIQRAFYEWSEGNSQWTFAEIARCSANRIAFVCLDRR